MSRKKSITLKNLLEEFLVTPDEQLYKVPQNWLWVKSQAIADWGSGGTPARKNLEYYNGDIPWIKSGELRDQVVFETEEHITKVAIKNSGAKIFPKGSVAIAMYGATIGRVGVLGIDAATNQACAVGTPKSPTMTDYMFYYFLSQREQLINLGKGGAQSNISLTIIKNYPFPLPPMSEQRRIVDRVYRLLEKISLAKKFINEARVTLELLREAIIDMAFSGELTVKWRKENSVSLEKWIQVSLKDILHVNPPKRGLDDIPDDQECSFIPMQAVSEITGTIAEPEIRKYSEVKKGYTFFMDGDVIFAKITPCMENGKSALVSGLINGFGFGSTEFFVLRAKDPDKINMKLIYYLIRSKSFRMQAKSVMSGAVGQQRVPKAFIEDYPFLLPPKEEQDQIVIILDSMFEKEKMVEEYISNYGDLENLEKSILTKAFCGELGTNDPAEESAIRLLIDTLSS